MLSLLWVTVQAAPFLRIAAGETIRPMAWATYVLTGALVLTAASIVSTVSAFKKGGSTVVCMVALVLSLLVPTLPTLSLLAAAKIKGFTLAP